MPTWRRGGSSGHAQWAPGGPAMGLPRGVNVSQQAVNAPRRGSWGSCHVAFRAREEQAVHVLPLLPLLLRAAGTWRETPPPPLPLAQEYLGWGVVLVPLSPVPGSPSPSPVPGRWLARSGAPHRAGAASLGLCEQRTHEGWGLCSAGSGRQRVKGKVGRSWVAKLLGRDGRGGRGRGEEAVGAVQSRAPKDGTAPEGGGEG